MKYAILLVALSLSGCVTSQQQAAMDAATCQSYGVAPGTREYYECRMVKDQQHIDQRAASLAQINEGLNDIAASTRPH